MKHHAALIAELSMLSLHHNLPSNVSDELRCIIEDHLEKNTPTKPDDVFLNQGIYGDEGATEANSNGGISKGTTLQTNGAPPSNGAVK